jgi:hypothetical protein
MSRTTSEEVLGLSSPHLFKLVTEATHRFLYNRKLIMSLTTGTLSLLPREVRDKIYSFVFDFTTPRSPRELPPPFSMSCKDKPHPARTSLLLASRRIHSEAQIVLYQVNEFGIWIDYDYQSNRDNKSIMGRPGYRVDFGLQEGNKEMQEDCFFKEPPKMEMLRHMQLIHLQVGTHGGIRECDIVPTKRQTVSGPERPTYRSLVEVVGEICEKLKECHQIHVLRVSIRSIEKTPGSVERVMDPIRSLRRIKQTNTVVFAMQEDQWVDWNMKGSYGRYMNKIMAMPEGTVAPRYVGDEKEPNQNEKKIFDMVGGKWLGGRSFAMPMPDEEDDDDIDEDEDVDDEHVWVDEGNYEYEMFMDAMDSGNFEEAFNIAHGGPLGPDFTTVLPPGFFGDDGGPLLGSFRASSALANAMDNTMLVPGLQEHFFEPVGPGLHHHCHHHHHHDEMESEDGEAEDDSSTNGSLG